MGLTERHWFENEDAPENYEWALEDAVYDSCTNRINRTNRMNMDYDYKSPIELVYKQIAEQMEVSLEEKTLKAITEVGIHVNKDELIKALNYDREQYQKGWNDHAAQVKGIVHCKDCKWSGSSLAGSHTCYEGMMDPGVRLPDNFFCAYGEVKQDEDAL